MLRRAASTIRRQRPPTDCRSRRAAIETISLSSAAATPSLYLAGNAVWHRDGRSATQRRRSAGSPDQALRISVPRRRAPSAPTLRRPTAHRPRRPRWWIPAAMSMSSATPRGNFGNQINQGTQDVYLTKYDSAGNVLWTQAAGQRGQRVGLFAGARSRPAAWSLPARPPPISPPLRSPTATLIVSSPSMMPTATRPGSSRSRRSAHQPGQRGQRRCQRQYLSSAAGLGRRDRRGPDCARRRRRLCRQAR